MESKSKGAPGFFDRERIKNSINWFVLLILFLGYALSSSMSYGQVCEPFFILYACPFIF